MYPVLYIIVYSASLCVDHCLLLHSLTPAIQQSERKLITEKWLGRRKDEEEEEEDDDDDDDVTEAVDDDNDGDGGVSSMDSVGKRPTRAHGSLHRPEEVAVERSGKKGKRVVGSGGGGGGDLCDIRDLGEKWSKEDKLFFAGSSAFATCSASFLSFYISFHKL